MLESNCKSSRTFKNNLSMKVSLFLLVIIFAACNNSAPKNEFIPSDTLQTNTDSIKKSRPVTIVPAPKTYFNKRFRNVTVENIEGNKFRIRGQGQIFEANFNWIVEDGHNELLKGFQTTDAGAPEWGNFDFIIEVTKQRNNSTLTLILFETSAMDGSRQYDLPIVLE